MPVFALRPEPKNQMWSFQIGPPRVASYRSLRSWTRTSFEGETALHASLTNVVRNEPENVLPPDFVTVLMTPPWNRPYSAEIPFTFVVVSWIASSTNRLFGVARMLSVMMAPSTV